MNEEESVSNQYSPINMVDSNDKTELMNTSLNEDVQKQQQNEEQDNQLENVNQFKDSNEDSIKLRTEENTGECSNVKETILESDKNTTNLNDDISDDENFKEDELDFEEGENSRGPGCNEETIKSKHKTEDGEVNSEEELEDGEVKEEDSDDILDENNDNDNPNNSLINKTSPANLNALCRFYSKGLCTWGNSCRFVHDKPPMGSASTASYSPQSNLINKSNENLNLNLNKNYQKYNNPSNYPKSTSSSNYYNQNVDSQSWERNTKYIKKDSSQFSSKNYGRSDEIDYYNDPQPTSKNKYQSIDDRLPSSNYSRQQTSSSYYTSKTTAQYHQSSTSSSQQSPSTNYRSSRQFETNNNTSTYESEYERKRRLAFLAFESAPWNDNPSNSPLTSSSLARSSSPPQIGDRHSQSSSGKLYKHHHSSSGAIKKADDAEHYRDPWRRSKSPYSTGSNRNLHPHQTVYSTKSKSPDSAGSNFSNSESELVDGGHMSSSSSHKKRLDPHYANKQRPSSSYHRSDGNGETLSYSSYDNQRMLDHHQSSSTNKKPYYKQQQGLLVDNELPSSYHHHSTTSSAYPKQSTTPTPPTNEMDIPNYERPKNIPPRTRKDSWSDSDSCSSSSNSSYSGSGSDEPYSRTNKFESTRGEGTEPQIKRQRTISDSRMSNSKHESNKVPYSPTQDYSSSLSRSYSSGRKKHLNCDQDDEDYDDGLELERTSQKKKLKNNGSGKNNSGSDSGDPKKKAELLQQLKIIEEAIARKRSKLK